MYADGSHDPDRNRSRLLRWLLRILPARVLQLSRVREIEGQDEYLPSVQDAHREDSREGVAMPKQRDLVDEFMYRLGNMAQDVLLEFVENYNALTPEQIRQHQAARRVSGKAPKQPKPPKATKVKREGPTLYDELEVSPRASVETIRAAYLSLSKRYHPDVSKHKEAAQRMKQINAAWTVLQDPVKRREYDAKLRREL